MGSKYSHETSGAAFQELLEDPVRLNRLEKLVFERFKDNAVLCEAHITDLTGMERCSSTARINALSEYKFIDVHHVGPSPKTKKKVKYYQITEKGKLWWWPKQGKLWINTESKQPTS